MSHTGAEMVECDALKYVGDDSLHRTTHLGSTGVVAAQISSLVSLRSCSVFIILSTFNAHSHPTLLNKPFLLPGPTNPSIIMVGETIITTDRPRASRYRKEVLVVVFCAIYDQQQGLSLPRYIGKRKTAREREKKV